MRKGASNKNIESGTDNKNIKLNVICTRISDEEKKALDKISRRNRTTISRLMREAMMSYASTFESSANRG